MKGGLWNRPGSCMRPYTHRRFVPLSLGASMAHDGLFSRLGKNHSGVPYLKNCMKTVKPRGHCRVNRREHFLGLSWRKASRFRISPQTKMEQNHF